MEIKIFCKDCGNELDAKIIHSSVPINNIEIKIEPCQSCIGSERRDAFEEGKEQGYSDGLLAGDK